MESNQNNELEVLRQTMGLMKASVQSSADNVQQAVLNALEIPGIPEEVETLLMELAAHFKHQGEVYISHLQTSYRTAQTLKQLELLIRAQGATIRQLRDNR